MFDSLPWRRPWFQITVFAVVSSAFILGAGCGWAFSLICEAELIPLIQVSQTTNNVPSSNAPAGTPTASDLDQAKQDYAQGETAIESGNNDEAAQDFSKALALNPAYANALCELGRAYGNEGKYNQAIEEYTKALALQPQNYVYLNNRGWVYNQVGNYNAALSDLNQSIASNANYALSFNNRGWTYLYLGNDAQALPDFEQSLAIDPKYFSNSDSYMRAAWIMSTSSDDKLRDGKKALDYIKQAGEATNWKTPASLNIMAAACAETGDYANAVKYSQQYLATPSLAQDDRDWGQRELACYQANKPFRR